MDAYENRMNNFLQLFKEFRDANTHLPNRGMLKLFAENVGLSPRFLSHVKCGRKQIGAAVARQIEKACNKPHGWLDMPHTDAQPNDADEQLLVEQLLAIYRGSPPKAKRLMADAIKAALGSK
jgi:transcriptional regulator with XRE-family HTH domain